MQPTTNGKKKKEKEEKVRRGFTVDGEVNTNRHTKTGVLWKRLLMDRARLAASGCR